MLNVISDHTGCVSYISSGPSKSGFYWLSRTITAPARNEQLIRGSVSRLAPFLDIYVDKGQEPRKVTMRFALPHALPSPSFLSSIICLLFDIDFRFSHRETNYSAKILHDHSNQISSLSYKVAEVVHYIRPEVTKAFTFSLI